MSGDIVDRAREALRNADVVSGLARSDSSYKLSMQALGVEARILLPEAIREIEELRDTINGKTFRVLSDDGEAWKSRAEAAEEKLAEIGEKP